MPTTRKTPTFREFMAEAKTGPKIDSTRFEQDLVSAWNAWRQIESTTKNVGTLKVARTKIVDAKDITPQNYQHLHAQNVALQMAWQLRYDMPAVKKTSLKKFNDGEASRDVGASGRRPDQIITPSYREAGVTSVTSKTDIILGGAKCSMKNADAAQFGSAQHGEMTAVISAVWPVKERAAFQQRLQQTFKQTLDKTNFYNLAKLYAADRKVVQAMSKDYDGDPKKIPAKDLMVRFQQDFSRRVNLHSSKKGMSSEEIKAFDAFLAKHVPKIDTKVLTDLWAKMNDGQFKRKLFREILTGEGRFTGDAPEKIADHMLLWNTRGGVHVYTIQQYLDDHIKHFQFSIRDRGSKRGAALRLSTMFLEALVDPNYTVTKESLSRQGRQLVEGLEEHFCVLEHQMLLTEGIGSWVSKATTAIADGLQVATKVAKEYALWLWNTLKNAVVAVFTKILSFLEMPSLEAFFGVVDPQVDAEIDLPAESIAPPPPSQSLGLLDGQEDSASLPLA